MSFIFILDLSDCSASHKSSHFTDFCGYKYIAKFGSKKEQPEKKPQTEAKKPTQTKSNQIRTMQIWLTSENGYLGF